MSLTYFKRYRMEIDLVGRDLSWTAVPQGYRLLPWDGTLLDAHAEAKYLSFRDEMDANVFPCLGELAGCRRLMGDIAAKSNFLPGATWLAVHVGPDGLKRENCGTIQGIEGRGGMGSIQNLGIAAAHRNRGLGTAMLFAALRGFRQAGLNRVSLEVTADNDGAVHLYRRHGFTTTKTVFKAAEVACT
jgi:ribosomal protein S18 acetylase RimI-like enzyme